MKRINPRPHTGLFTQYIARQIAVASVFLLSGTGCTYISQIWPEEPNKRDQATTELPVQDVASDTLPTLPAEPEGGTSVSVRPLNLETAGEVEVTWAVPEEAVDSYVLHYGTSRENLDKELMIEGPMLERTTGANQLPMYRYVLKGVPVYQNLYIALSAVRGGGVSPMTEIIEVQRLPGTRN